MSALQFDHTIRSFFKEHLRTLIDYWIDDKQWVAPPALAEVFFQKVDTLRAAVDRLEARLQAMGVPTHR
jgi:ubiquinone biosynthesis protein UbiJ